MTIPTTANFAHHSSGIVRVTIDGSDSFFRRRQERTMAVRYDGDDIVLYRYSSEESFQPRDLPKNGGEGIE